MKHKVDNLSPKQFKDKNGRTIKAGDVLIRRFFSRTRERAGMKRVAVDGFSGKDVIVNDEGSLLEPKEHWVKYHVEYLGACLIASRGECSDFQVLTSTELFDSKNREISEGSGFHYLNSVFNSEVYEVYNEQQD